MYEKKRRKEGNVLMTHSTHFIYDYMVSDIVNKMVLLNLYRTYVTRKHTLDGHVIKMQCGSSTAIYLFVFK